MSYIVYKHTTPDGRAYIGASSHDIEKRSNYHWGYCTQEFGKAVEKYGWKNIKHEVLYSGLTEDEAFELEKTMIAKYKTFDPLYGYNRTRGGKGYTAPHNEETKNKISNSLKEHFKEHPIWNRTKIDCYLHGTFYKSYDSIQDAANDLGIKAYCSIVNVLKGRAKQTRQGYSFVYK